MLKMNDEVSCSGVFTNPTVDPLAAPGVHVGPSLAPGPRVPSALVSAPL
jgi:hypothetical protein